MRPSAARFLLLLHLGAPPVVGQTIAWEGSLEGSTGRYIFAERTTTLTLSNGLAITAGPFTLRATAPLWLQNSTVVTAGGSGLVPSGGSSSGPVADSGRARRGGRTGGVGGPAGAATDVRALGGPVDVPNSSFTSLQVAVGDPVASLQARLTSGRAALRVAGHVKVPLADTASFGTGRWDAGLSAGLDVRAGERTGLDLEVRWWRLGDLPGLPLLDVIGGAVTMTRLLRAGWAASLWADGASSAVEGYDPPIRAGVAWSRAGRNSGWGLELGIGLTETTADLSLAASWRVRLGGGR